MARFFRLSKTEVPLLLNIDKTVCNWPYAHPTGWDVNIGLKLIKFSFDVCQISSAATCDRLGDKSHKSH